MSNTISIDELIEQEYEQQYFEECKFIWQNFVPKRGQARNLQGELLREIENIRCEAQDNGNVNWDDDFTYFCEFIKQSLIEQPISICALIFFSNSLFFIPLNLTVSAYTVEKSVSYSFILLSVRIRFISHPHKQRITKITAIIRFIIKPLITELYKSSRYFRH